jgi:hypothetical protein
MRNTEAKKSNVEAHDYLDAEVPRLERSHHKRRRILERRGFTRTQPDALLSPSTPSAVRRRPAESSTIVSPTASAAEVRAWARAQGIDVPPRGRLRAEVVDAWNAAHPTVAVAKGP